ncbi:MAG: PaaI family thioesterase [Gammaproteobacteria bacterium]|nr:PaaI family thioesterase [Gammaproteobacteria bacterium]
MNDFEEYRREFDDHALHKMLGINLVARRPGFGRICLTKNPGTPQGIGGGVHGGILAAMVDIAMLVAVFSDMREGAQPAGTADLNISYLRQAHGDHIYADATVVKRGRQLAMIEVSIIDDEDRLCAKGRTLYAFRTG